MPGSRPRQLQLKERGNGAMRTWTKFCTGLALVAGLTPVVRAHVPGAAPAPAGGVAAAGTAAPAGPTTIWAKLGLSFEAKDKCKARFCASPIGKMAQQMLKPVNAFAGGMFDCCPVVSPADLAKPSDSAEGAAAQIKKDEAEAKARRAAVRYLGTVDCVHWPEPQDGLINGLRADRNECVRLEAAFALGRGCCCNRKTIEAMRLTVEGSDADGNPPENSERVRAAAAAALNHCLACLTE